MMESWRKFLHLNSFERSIVLESMLGLTATWVGFRLAGFQRCKNLLAWFTRAEMRSAARATSEENACDITRMEQAAARHLPFSTNCLEQSLVLLWLLRKRRIGAELRIGARKQLNRFEAHAWVEFKGVVLNDAGEDHHHFVPFEGPVGPLETQTH